MRLLYFFLMTIALALMSSFAHAQLPTRDASPNISARLVAESDQPAPGKIVTLAFVMTPKAGWHGYWENPGDAGVGMTLKWDIPQGVKTGSLRYPVPETLIISGLMNYVYEADYALLVDIAIPDDWRAGQALPIKVHGEWLSCTRQICVPERGDMALNLIVGDGHVDSDRRGIFDEYRSRLPRPLGSPAHYAIKDGIFRLAIPYPADAAVDEPYFFPLTDGAITYSAPQKVTRNGDMLVLESKAGGGPQEKISGILKTGKHKGLLLSVLPGSVPSTGTPLAESNGTAPGVGEAGSVFLALGGALLGGLLLNIMPCVFPILSLKALKLAKAGGDERIVRRDSLAYAAGAVTICLALGGALIGLRASGAAVGWAFQLQDPRIILLLLLLVTAIALNLAGLFELRNVGAGSHLTAQGGAAGSFWTGALAAFVATPCTGPFMGAALGAALVLPVAAALAIFAGLGVGLALPFLLIAFIPALRGRLPKPGAWMETLRRILSVPMFATGLALLWLLGRQTGTAGMTAGIAMAVFAGLLLWWLGVRQRRNARHGPLFATAILLVLGISLVALPERQGVTVSVAAQSAEPFNEAKLATLRRKGPVFLYFTADWCLTCKANEAAAIDRQEVIDAFAKAGVKVMVGDWTNGDADIGRFLEQHGRSGVPLYLWYVPGKDAQVLPQILTPSLLGGLARG